MKVEEVPKQESKGYCFKITAKEAYSKDTDEMVWKNYAIIVSTETEDEKLEWMQKLEKTVVTVSKVIE